MGNWIRKAIVIAVLLALWEVGARMADAPLLFPTFIDVCQALADSITAGDGSLLSIALIKSCLSKVAIGCPVNCSFFACTQPPAISVKSCLKLIRILYTKTKNFWYCSSIFFGFAYPEDTNFTMPKPSSVFNVLDTLLTARPVSMASSVTDCGCCSAITFNNC